MLRKLVLVLLVLLNASNPILDVNVARPIVVNTDVGATSITLPGQPHTNAGFDDGNTSSHLSTPVDATPTIVITLTSTGFTPTVLITPVGSQVTWYNATGQTQVLVSGEPHRIYLPLVVRSAGTSARANDVNDQLDVVPPVTYSRLFTATLAPGDTFTYTFNAEGTFPFYLSTAPQFSGRVVAELPLPPDPSTIAPPVDQTVAATLISATDFLYSGPNPIQTGVVSGTIQPLRVAVLRGKVLTRAGTPLHGVTITIFSHPEFGQTLSRADGMFDLAVNGGGQLTVQYEKDGYLPAQRSMTIPWQDYVVLPDVVMIPQDPNVTVIDLSANTPMQVARGQVISDSDGLRQETLLFPISTTAVMSLPSGITQTLTTLHVRATEYTIGPNGPQTMPAELPPNSAYTYATEFNADEAVAAGATTVYFTPPLISYNENFLSFPVGITVPVGSYDRERDVWLPSDNGRVIKIMSIAGGMAELDTDGDDVVDNGLELGVTAAERQTLAGLYTAGTTLWRSLLSHFSSWDCNWGWGPPPDSTPPDQLPPSDEGSDDSEDSPDGGPCDSQCCEEGSVIGCQRQTLGETVDVIGTPFKLSYISDRAPGYVANDSLHIPLSGDNVPASLKQISLQIMVAGRTVAQSFPRAIHQSAAFVWDGRDAYGRVLQGKQPISVRIGYVYDGVYQRVDRFGYNGNGALIEGNRTRQEVTLWQEWHGSIGGWDARAAGLGGWSLSVHHDYDAVGRVLYLGGGGRRNSTALAATINTVAGTGLSNWGSVTVTDNITATSANLSQPYGIAFGPDGSLYVADYADQRIRRVDASGIITTVAGDGVFGYNGDGIPATQAQLYGPSDVALGSDGSLYIADYGASRIRRVDASSIITTVAGSCTPYCSGFAGDGGPATQALLRDPFGVAVAPDGSLFIADTDNNRIRRVGPDGIITTVAGGGNPPDGLGDGGPATQARLDRPADVAVGPDGSLYIADPYNNRIRRVGPDGIITTVAGSGQRGFGGDGGPATLAELSGPESVAVAPDGSLFIADDRRVRRVGTDGIINTVAGSGEYSYASFSGDGGPATQAPMCSPSGVAVKSDGTLLISDNCYVPASYQGSRIRRVASPLPGMLLGDVAIPSTDGTEVYVFSGGRHVRTLNSLTNSVLYKFTYDNAGRLTAITDGDGNLTTIERDLNGNPTALVAPGGQRTTLAVNANGYLASITDPAGEAVQLTYTADGLLTHLTNPRGYTANFNYDSLGRLTKDEDPAGGFKAFTRSDSTNGYTVMMTTAMSRMKVYQVERLSTGDRRYVNTFPDGTHTATLLRTDGSQTVTYPDGTVVTSTLGPDPRWGMLAPVETSLTVTLPSGLTSNVQIARTAALSDTVNPFSLRTLTQTLILNGRPYTSTYDTVTRIFTDTTAAGRQSFTSLDNKGRVIRAEIPGLVPVQFTYDNLGRLTNMTQGERHITVTYDAHWNLANFTDPLARLAHFDYDLAGRVVTQTLPDLRQISYSYDANGNLTSLAPPGRPAHSFSYTPLDLMERYSPPDVNPGVDYTQYAYNPDRQLSQIGRPDGQIVQLSYGNAGRLSGLTQSTGTVSYTYQITTGNLITLAAPSGITLGNRYDGSLLTSQTWYGPISGTMSRTVDNDFRVTSRSVNGTMPASLQYDSDGLLVQAGSLALTRDAQNGLLTGSALGNITDTWSYNAFGEPISYTTSSAGTPLLDVQYVRDQLGRITRKTETIGGVSTVYSYTYDLAGRLTTVISNDVMLASYTYDSNGNRLSYTSANGIVSGTYDAQDRLLQYGATTYGYTANGELMTKTIGAQTTNYQYDALGNLITVTLPGGPQIAYLVDGQNRRVGKKVNGVLTQGFLYESQLRPIAELDGAGNIASRFIYATRVNVPDYMIKNGVTYRFVLDHLGSPRLIVNAASGQIAQRMDYDEFGRVLTDTNPGFQPFGFAGGIYDRDTNLIRFGARDYDAATGRWTATDPIRFIGLLANLFDYVGDSVNRFDPFGLDWEPSPWDSIGGGIGAAGVGASELGNLDVGLIFGAGTAGEVIAASGGVLGAGLFGYGVGTAEDWFYRTVSGQSLGADLYEIFHPEDNERIRHAKLGDYLYDLLHPEDKQPARNKYGCPL